MNANTSLALVAVDSNDVMTTTLQAPPSLPSSLPTGSSEVLTLSTTTGNTAWQTMAQALGATNSNTGKYLKCAATETSYNYTWTDLPTATAAVYGNVKVYSVQSQAVAVNAA
jgi:hypothetical protein